jgi:hypothetical protein
MLLLVSIIRHLNSIINYLAICMPLLRRNFRAKASKIKESTKKKPIRLNLMGFLKLLFRSGFYQKDYTDSFSLRLISYLRIFSTSVVRRIFNFSAARATTPVESSNAC